MNDSTATPTAAARQRVAPNPGGQIATGSSYALALIGAAVYFIQQAETFGEGMIGLLKAIVWPAVLTYHVLDFLKL